MRDLTQCTADGGVLLLSAYSEAEDDESQREVFQVAWQRLINRDVPQDRLEKIRDSRNNVVFSLAASRVAAVLKEAGWRSPLQLYQGLFIRLWLCRAEGHGTHPAMVCTMGTDGLGGTPAHGGVDEDWRVILNASSCDGLITRQNIPEYIQKRPAPPRQPPPCESVSSHQPGIRSARRQRGGWSGCIGHSRRRADGVGAEHRLGVLLVEADALFSRD